VRDRGGSRRNAGSYDAIVVGAGHNGLVAGFSLARAGLRVLILERRDIVGGACVTEEFAPGFRASTGAYVLSMLREPIWRDMQLRRRGVAVDPAGPTLNLYPDGERYLLSDDMAETIEETRRFSSADADALVRFEHDLGELARAVVPFFDRAAFDPRLRGPGDVRSAFRYARILYGNRRLAQDLAFLFSTSVRQFLAERFRSEHVMAALGWHAINDSLAGPSTPGTAYVLLHDHASDAGDGPRNWGFVRGGMGRVTELMAEAARQAGAEIRLGAAVARVRTRDGRATGVVLESGEEISSRRVLSNADPKRTFLRLCDPDDLPASFVGAIDAYRCEGSSMKINLGLSGLPRLAGGNGGEPEAYHTGIMELDPFLPDMDAHQAEAQRGIPADPAHIELCFPTVHDASLAPEGKHIMTIDVNSQPYRLAGGDWDAIKEERADRAIAQITEHFPTLPDLIEHRQVLSPLDLERVLGLTGGHALHGDMAPDQLLFLRPVRGYGDYRTPIRDLYLCGAGTHPGGGVTGANGRNCAREVLRDAKRRVA
jgi:phytoene dehydrogenase-like protein